jgi:hypothetical protein
LEAELEARLCGPPPPPQAVRPLSDGAWIHTELRKPGVTLELLIVENYLIEWAEGWGSGGEAASPFVALVKSASDKIRKSIVLRLGSI